MGLLIPLVVTLTVVYWTSWIIYARYFHPLSQIPGPWLASVSRTWYMLQIVKGNMEQSQRKLHAQYGPLIRIAPNEIACADPNAIKTIYRTQAAFNKTDFYTPWNSHNFSKHRDGFTETNDKQHGQRRRIVQQVYTLSNVLKSEKYIDKCSELFLERLGEYADAGKKFDLGEWLQMYAFDVVGELYFGRMFGFLEKGVDHNDWIHSLDLLMPFLCVTSVAPSYIRNLILMSALVVPGSVAALKAIENIGSSARVLVAKRKGEHTDAKSQRTDMFQQLYDIHVEKGDQVDFQMGDIEQEAFIALLAGSDTTAIGFRTVFYYLMKKPDVYAQLMEELETAKREGRLSHPVTYAEASQLPFLCACVKEALRIHPGVQLTMAREVPAGGLDLCGKFIAAGYRVGMNSAVVHYDTTVFGKDAADYRPSRWLESPEAATKMDKSMLHFGAGTRTCIGKNISMAEIHKLVPDVMMNFKMEMWTPEATWTTRNLWFCKQTGIEVRLTRRT